VKFQIGGCGADYREWKDSIALANRGERFDHDAWADYGAGADFDLRPDHRARADFDAGVEFGALVDYGGGMDCAGYGSFSCTFIFLPGLYFSSGTLFFFRHFHRGEFRFRRQLVADARDGRHPP
jgi:hypothetical protein